MATAAFDRAFERFNRECVIPSPVNYALFSTSADRSVNLIAATMGEDHQSVQYLRATPPVPMVSPSAWPHFVGRYYCALTPETRTPIELRPDLPLYPVYMMTVAMHEATHACDPEFVKLAELAHRLVHLQEGDAEYDTIAGAHEDYKIITESTAVGSEIGLLERVACPANLLPEQKAYFDEQRTALLANRKCTLAGLEAYTAGTSIVRTLQGYIGGTPEGQQIRDTCLAILDNVGTYRLRSPESVADICRDLDLFKGLMSVEHRERLSIGVDALTRSASIVVANRPVSVMAHVPPLNVSL